MRDVLLDAGPLVAALDARDAHHAWAVEGLKRTYGALATVWPAVTEAAWLLASRGASPRALFELLEAKEVEVVEMGAADFGTLAHLLDLYADLPMDLADAALVHAYARDGFEAVMTVDRRDFLLYRVGGKAPRVLAPEPRS